MKLLPSGHKWYENYVNIEGRETHQNENGHHVFSANLVADILIPLLSPMFRYEPCSNAWYSFTGTHWQQNNSLYMVLRDVIAEMKRDLQAKKGMPQFMTGLSKAHGPTFTDNVINILQRDLRMQILPQEFDTNSLLLNTPEGLYNLLTNTLLEQAASNFCRQITTVAPNDDQDGSLCPNYINHIKFMAHGDPEMEQYLEELSGYILTGETFQQEFYWFHGLASTGKSSLAGVWLYILNEYGYLAPQAQFADTYNTPHPEQDMRLIGKRFVFIDELKGKFNEAKIKAITSGNPITAREMHGKTINFMPVCKLLFTSNNKPPVDGADAGFARRLKILPFAHQISEANRIKDFDKSVLRAEAPYILNRMMYFAQQVLSKKSLIKVAIVDSAGSSYMNENDLLAQFIADACTSEVYDSEPMKALYDAFMIWCNENNHDAPSKNAFGRMLNNGNLKSSQLGGGTRVRVGIKLTEVYRKKILTQAHAVYN
jgi:putative DNA primase/helicase